MGYRKPDTVNSPKNRWVFGKTLCDLGQGQWSAAKGVWDGNQVVAIRWNGDDDSGQHGNPQSHGNPTWFIMPRELEEAVVRVSYKLSDVLDLVTCDITRPHDFMFGVYKVRIELVGRFSEKPIPNELMFDIPEFPKRLFRPTEMHYMVPPSGPKQPWRGRFVDHAWEGILQTNGIAEENNPTAVDVVRDALVANVVWSILPWVHVESNTM